MKKAIIWGIGQFAQEVYCYLQQDRFIEICGFAVDDEYCSTNEFCGLPLVDIENVETVFSPKEYGVFICVGYAQMNTVRERMFLQARTKGYEILSYQHPSSVVNAKSMGTGTIILANVTIGPESEIGDGNIFWDNSILAHNACMGNFNYLTVSASLAGRVTIGNNCFFGNNCTVRDSIKIADFTLVGAGCYVSRDTEPYGVYVPTRSVYLQGKKSVDFCL